METAAVTTPRPPTWMSSRITACPKEDQKVAVSCTTRPVTHTAETAVNRLSAKPALPGARRETGSISSSVPARISAAKPSTMIRKGVRRKTGRRMALLPF